MAVWASSGRTPRTGAAATWGRTCAALLFAATVQAGGSACTRDEPPPEPPPPQAKGPAPADLPRTARRDVLETLQADLAAVRHAADGGGSARAESLGLGSGGEEPAGPVTTSAGGSGRWRIRYTAGPLGVAVGGAVYLQVSPFWGWSTPQVERAEAPGFTRVSSSAQGLELAPRTLDRQLLEVRVGGRALGAGESLEFLYGAGEPGARADDFAERGSRFWIAVDGDGDGVRALIADSPGVDVAPGPAAILSVTAPSLLRPGERGELTLALLDGRANVGVLNSARVTFPDAPASLGLAESILLRAEEGARARLPCTPMEEGTFRWRARAVLDGGGELECLVGPLVVHATAPRVLWADLHGHSQVSDGTGTPEDYWTYARDVAGLDAAALTDHDHWGMEFLDGRPERWRELVALAGRFDRPGSFVALPGYEYTDWIHGHRCVLWFEDDAELHSALDPRSDTPQELWELLRGRLALTIPHHVAGGPVALDWSIQSDPELEPVVEISSVHGTSEALDAGRRIYAPVPGHFARDALRDSARDGSRRPLRLGFLGGGDSHDGHPGLAHLGGHNPNSGLAGIVCEERTREAILGALRARRVFATSGQRIVVRFALGGHPMGASVDAAELAAGGAFFASAAGTGKIARLEILGGDGLLLRAQGEGSPDLEVGGTLPDLRPGDFVYVRAVQEDGAQAWSSPVFVR